MFLQVRLFAPPAAPLALSLTQPPLPLGLSLPPTHLQVHLLLVVAVPLACAPQRPSALGVGAPGGKQRVGLGLVPHELCVSVGGQ